MTYHVRPTTRRHERADRSRTDRTGAWFDTVKIPADRLAVIREAADWVMGEVDPPRPLVPELRRRFVLSVSEACTVIALCNARRSH